LHCTGPMACPRCQKERVRVVSGRTVALPNGPTMPTCGHSLCEDCWVDCAVAQLPGCRADGKRHLCCCSHGCTETIPLPFWRQFCSRSHELCAFNQENRAEEVRLHSLSLRFSIAWGQPSSEVGLQCSVCCSLRTALLTNRECAHTACEDCWTSWAEVQVKDCRSERRLRPRCLGANCHCAISLGTSTKSDELSVFFAERDAEVLRMRNTACDLLLWAPLPTEPGPVCPICGDKQLALIHNQCCGSSACEACWSRWAETQLPQCIRARDVAIHCLGVGCQLPATAVWAHVRTLSPDVRSLDAVLSRRTHIKANELFPAEMQVECPRAECLGIGYLGFDTVMCFMCEHQWIADGGDPPQQDIGEELLAGALVKKCPSCSAPIVKNGGCDHMTCHCKHEFYWSTLLPYCRRRGL